MELKIKVEKGYDLEKAICNHGLFMTAPNQWNSCNKTFCRPLRLQDGSSSVNASISQLDAHFLLVNLDSFLSQPDQQCVLKQLERMLRLTNKDEEDVNNFAKVDAKATSNGFARLFRSPHLFEDIIKTILLCNTTFNRTLQMCESLCDLQLKLQSRKGMKKRGRPKKLDGYFSGNKICNSKSDSVATLRTRGNFPNWKELAGLDEAYLKEHCKLGFRAKWITKLAKSVENGKLNLLDLEKATFDQIRAKLIKFKGIGPFAADNILMCMGDYRNIPTDTETIHHLREVHHISKCTAATVQTYAKEIYDKYAPYQCLAYWHELVESYERELGAKLSEVSSSCYHKVTGSYLSNNKFQKEEQQSVAQVKRKRAHSQASICD